MPAKQSASLAEETPNLVPSGVCAKESCKKSDKEVVSRETIVAAQAENTSLSITGSGGTTKASEHESAAGGSKIVSLNQVVKEGDSLSVKCTSPLVAKVATENRQFQKTRSFSAVEDNPGKKMIKVPSGKSGDFCFKDVAHSRSEQLDPTKMNSPKADQEARKSRGNDRDADCLGQEADKRKTADKCRMMDQLSYFSDAQPMSLQHDSSYCVEFGLGRKDSRDIRKSGRDLSNLSTNETGDLLERPKSSRATTRARLEKLPVKPVSHSLYYFIFFSITHLSISSFQLLHHLQYISSDTNFSILLFSMQIFIQFGS